jgi:biogenesis of lysosome-related organelles complex 1 subunit KXD1
MRIEASRRLQETKQSLKDGMRIAREVKADLEWSEAKVKELSRKTKEVYPREYEVATMRIGPHNI